eukprot:GHVR01088153.1.p1 GENE.GHVR01088153.1~~GHVR01088153.1.p1  ORF type:complete len:232 (-),score=8.25 GHVR01088153.1:211-906(-)
MLLVTRCFLPLLRVWQKNGFEKKHGCARIVNVGSILGRVGLPGVCVYSASKFAVRGASESLRRELSQWGIRVCLVEPGGCLTDFFQNIADDDVLNRVMASSPAEAVAAYGVSYHNRQMKMFLRLMSSISCAPAVVVRVLKSRVTDRQPCSVTTVGYDTVLFQALCIPPVFLSDLACRIFVKLFYPTPTHLVNTIEDSTHRLKRFKVICAFVFNLLLLFILVFIGNRIFTNF